MSAPTPLSDRNRVSEPHGYRRGRGTLFFGIAATTFLLVHLPFTWAAISDSGQNPFNASSPYNPGEWLATVFAIPLMTAVAGFLESSPGTWCSSPAFSAAQAVVSSCTSCCSCSLRSSRSGASESSER
jgi:hypothetical protein